MGTAKLNIWLRNVNCEPLVDVWRTDLVIQLCSGSYLVNVWPEIVDQLKRRYATPAWAESMQPFPSLDQGGKTVVLTLNGVAQTLTFTAPVLTLDEAYAQMAACFTGCTITRADGRLRIEGAGRGPTETITVGGTADIDWITGNGGGYRILSHFYQGAQRIMLMPPAGQRVNHIEAEIPPGCYKIWTRVCHGANEETSLQMVAVRCGEEACVNLLLPTVKTCAAGVLFPAIDHILYNGALQDQEQRLVALRAFQYVAQLAKADVVNMAEYRYQEAVEKGDTALQARAAAVQALAALLPECC